MLKINIAYITIVAAMAAALTGCKTTETLKNNEAAIGLAVQYATVKAVDGIRELDADRVIAFCNETESYLADGTFTLDEVVQAVKARIPFQKFKPEERVLIDGLFEIVAEELRKRVSDGLLQGDDVTTINRLIDYVRQGAVMARDP